MSITIHAGCPRDLADWLEGRAIERSDDRSLSRLAVEELKHFKALLDAELVCQRWSLDDLHWIEKAVDGKDDARLLGDVTTALWAAGDRGHDELLDKLSVLSPTACEALYYATKAHRGLPHDPDGWMQVGICVTD